MSRSSIFATFAIVGLIAAAVPARADDVQTRSRIVRIGGLDLRTASGQAALRHRIAVAARQVCGPQEMFGTTGYQSYNACVQQAEKDAAARVRILTASRTTDVRYAAN